MCQPHQLVFCPTCPRVWALGKLGRAPAAPSPLRSLGGVHLLPEDVGDLVQAVLATEGRQLGLGEHEQQPRADARSPPAPDKEVNYKL